MAELMHRVDVLSKDEIDHLVSSMRGEDIDIDLQISQHEILRDHITKYPEDGHTVLLNILDKNQNQSSSDVEIVKSVLRAWLRTEISDAPWKSIKDSLQSLIEAAPVSEWEHYSNPFTSTVDSLTRAINHWSGNLTELWIRAVRAAHIKHKDSWTGLSSHISSVLVELIQRTDVVGSHSRVMVARHINLLYKLDRTWTLKYVRPLFDTSTDIEQAIKCWNGYFYASPPSQNLLEDGFLEDYLNLIPLINPECPSFDQLSEGWGNRIVREFAEHLASIATMDPDCSHDWLYHFVKRATPELRTSWASNIAYRLSHRLSPKEVTSHWNCWMKDYWEQRLCNEETSLVESEATAMVEWTISLGRDFPQGVTLALKSPSKLPLHLSKMLYRLAFPKIDNDPGWYDPLKEHPEETIRLLVHLFQRTRSAWTVGEPNRYCIAHIIQRLDELSGSGRIGQDKLLPLQTEFVRLGFDR